MFQTHTRRHTHTPHPCTPLQLVLSVTPLEGHIADLDGLVTFTYRQPPIPAAPRHAAAAAHKQHGHAGGAATDIGSGLAVPAALVQEQQAFVPVESMYFRGGETGVRWISQITGRDLLWQ